MSSPPTSAHDLPATGVAFGVIALLGVLVLIMRSDVDTERDDAERMIAANAICDGQLHEERGDHAKAIEAYSIAIEAQPTDATPYLLRGQMYNKLYQNYVENDQAIRDLTTAIRLNPTCATAYHQRGIAFCRAERIDESISDLTRAIELEPGNASLFLERGSTYRYDGRRDQHEEALADFARAIEIDPGHISARYARARLLFRHYERHQEALADLDVVLADAPRFAQAYYLRHLCLTALGDTARAAADLNKAQSLASFPFYGDP